MKDESAWPLKPLLVGEKLPRDMPDDRVADWGWPWPMLTRGVICRPLGTRLWKEADFRFLFGPVCPAEVGEPGREPPVGVMVAEVSPDIKEEFESWCTWLFGLNWN